MKFQALFSMKNKNKIKIRIRLSSVAVVTGVSVVKQEILPYCCLHLSYPGS